MALLLSTAATNLSWKLLSNFGDVNVQQLSSTPPNLLLSGLTVENKKHKKRTHLVDLAVKSNTTSIETKQPRRRRVREKLLSEGRDEDENLGPICPGCGVFMQDEDPNLPGYYKEKKVVTTETDELLEFEDGDIEGELEGFVDGLESEEEKSEEDVDEGSDEELEAILAKLEGEEDDMDLDGFAPAGVGYGNITEEFLEKQRKAKELRKLSKSERKRRARGAEREKDDVTVCARCHSLRHYGQVKNNTAENLIPDFDFDRLITTRLMKPGGNGDATVVVLVVDCVDFDGSFPKRAVKSLFKAMDAAKDDPRASKRLPKLVLVGTKADLLPSQISPTRLDRWVRSRARAAGAPKFSGVFLVSSRKDLGVRNLLAFIKQSAGPRGNVWVIGAQNAGKSTLINTFAKKGGAKITKLTEAAVPGTTLGILRIGGILPAKAKLYDTPGLLHPYLMSTKLSRDEQKLVELRKELKPRTYRIMVGQSVHVGGLLRLDLSQASVQTIYVTVWVSPNVSLHMGKTENADELWRKHVGIRLQPPVGEHRASELGKLEAREIKVTGTSWDVNSMDISVAGLGWISLGLKGEATLTFWAYNGIQVAFREPLVLDRAEFLERPGFLLPKAISDVIGNKTKHESEKKKKVTADSEDSVLEMSF
ncbi:GTP-binding protein BRASSINAZOLE INSENSITIVE PALE GREEN 2, chloroplastic [Turnera subulata]|uniref:GTP-binding protein BRASSINAZOLE INSENSITIVE PALE GREEN 2, chloroplastic n=1 Tax=Turnera subulata TaxID=218843 RepID=A0A9Q0G8X5_9ROSI|nr:GTP-binding protein BRASSINAZOLE INSENSITIVE PALE GREEN 2, chloroplastic [Turnera subulata]